MTEQGPFTPGEGPEPPIPDGPHAALLEAVDSLNRITVSPDSAEGAVGQYVHVQINPELEADNTLTIELSCVPLAQRQADWGQLFVRLRREDDGSLYNPNLGSRGLGSCTGLPRAKYKVYAWSRLDTRKGPRMRGRVGAGDLQGPQAERAAGPRNVLVEDKETGIQALVTQRGGKVIINFEAGDHALAGSRIDLRLVATDTREEMVSGEARLEPLKADDGMPYAGGRWEGEAPPAGAYDLVFWVTPPDGWRRR
jgi:hypothetical protein